MALPIRLDAKANSSSTSAPGSSALPSNRRASKDFSSLMRAISGAGRPVVIFDNASRSPMVGDVGAELGRGDANIIGPRGDPAERRAQDGSRHLDPDLEGQGAELSAWVDPLQRALAQPLLLPSREAAAPPLSHATFAMDEIERAVRRIAWGGDRQRSVAYIELAAGELSGATLTLEARGKAVSVVVDVAPGTSTAGWAERLAERLAGRGLEVESVLVR